MKGDRMLCLNPFCYNLFKDINGFSESRDNKNKRMCPNCHGSNTVNVEALIKLYWVNKATLVLPSKVAFIFKLLKRKNFNFDKVKI